jgi:hypothetical protein
LRKIPAKVAKEGTTARKRGVSALLIRDACVPLRRIHDNV